MSLGQALSTVVTALPPLAYVGIFVFLVAQRHRSPRRVTFALIGVGLLIAHQVVTTVFAWFVFPQLAGGAAANFLASTVNSVFTTLLFLAGFVLMFVAALITEPTQGSGTHSGTARPGPYAAATGPYDPRSGGTAQPGGPPQSPGPPAPGSGTGLPEPPGPPRGDVIEGP